MSPRTGVLVGVGAAASLAAAYLVGLKRKRAAEITHLRAHLRGLPRLEDRFDASMVAGLPDPASRYLLHAIAPGTPLATRAELSMLGAMRLAPDGAWLPLCAREIIAPPDGIIWEASVGSGLQQFSGADSYVGGHGVTAFQLWGLVPVVQATGPDIARSARGRLAGEAIWNPATLLPQRGVIWAAVDEHTAQATLTVDGDRIVLTLTVEPSGRLRSVSLLRWGNQTADGRFAEIPFGCDFQDERAFGGYTIPVIARAGWWYGTDRFFEFFHASISAARFE